jgi:hypothetical protein
LPSLKSVAPITNHSLALKVLAKPIAFNPLIWGA